MVRQGSALIEIGGDQVDHLVERGGEGGLLGGDGRSTSVGGLEESRVDHHLMFGCAARGTERHPQVFPAGQGAGDPGHGAGHPLVAADHRLDNAFLRRQDLGQQ